MATAKRPGRDDKEAIGLVARNGRAIRGLVFDLDGVLVDTEHLWEEAWTACSREHQVTWTREDTLRAQGMSPREWSAYLAGRAGDHESAASVASTCVTMVLDAIGAGRGPLLDGAKELVELTSAKVPIALASSAPRQVIDVVLATHGLAPLFRATVASEEVEHGKPNPDVYLEAIRRLGLSADQVVALEDSNNGVRAAHAAGLSVLALPRPAYRLQDDTLGLVEAVLDGPKGAIAYLLKPSDR